MPRRRETVNKCLRPKFAASVVFAGTRRCYNLGRLRSHGFYAGPRALPPDPRKAKRSAAAAAYEESAPPTPTKNRSHRQQLKKRLRQLLQRLHAKTKNEKPAAADVEAAAPPTSKPMAPTAAPGQDAAAAPACLAVPQAERTDKL